MEPRQCRCHLWRRLRQRVAARWVPRVRWPGDGESWCSSNPAGQISTWQVPNGSPGILFVSIRLLWTFLLGFGFLRWRLTLLYPLLLHRMLLLKLLCLLRVPLFHLLFLGVVGVFLGSLLVFLFLLLLEFLVFLILFGG